MEREARIEQIIQILEESDDPFRHLKTEEEVLAELAVMKEEAIEEGKYSGSHLPLIYVARWRYWRKYHPEGS